MQCIKITAAGNQCKNVAIDGEEVCQIHKRFAKKEEPEVTQSPPVKPDEKTKPEEILSEDLIEVAKKSNEFANKSRKEAKKGGIGVLRTKGGGPDSQAEVTESDIPYPAEAHGKDFELYGPQGMASSIPDEIEIAAYSADQPFVVVPEKVRHLMFTKPGQNLPKKRLYTIKALHRDGRLVQLPFEAQIQNNAGGDMEDAIGLRRYQRKGITVLIDFNTLTPVYCAAWGCYARAAQEGSFVGFCSQRHAKHTLPNQYKDAGAIVSGIFGDNATTSRTWAV